MDDTLDEESNRILDDLINGIERPPTIEDLEGDCKESLAVAVINERFGRKVCATCSRQPDCDAWHGRRRISYQYYQDCFGIPVVCHPSLRPFKCDVCELSRACKTVQRLTADLAPPADLSTAAKLAVVSPAPISVPEAHLAATVAISPKVKETATKTVADNPGDVYIFPIDPVADDTPLKTVRLKSTPQLIDWLRQLFDMVRESKGNTNYIPYRKSICAISLELNRRGDYLPRFRPVKRGNFLGKNPVKPDDALLANDFRVIDLDWLARHSAQALRSCKVTLIGADSQLDIGAASRFASSPGSAGKKAEVLTLTPTEEAQLFMIQGSTISERWKSLMRSKGIAITKIRATKERNHNQIKGELEWLWQFYALAKLIGEDAGSLRRLTSRLGEGAVGSDKARRTHRWLKEKAGLLE